MFLLNRIDGGYVPAFEYLPAGTITPKIGMVLTQSSGKLAVATGTTKPTYVSVVERSAALTDGEVIPVVRVSPNMVFETTFSADASAVAIGSKVTLHASNGGQVTATTTSGVAEIVAKEGTGKSGDTCFVRFS